MKKFVQRSIAVFLIAFLLLSGGSASAKTVAEWLEGYASGENWFGENYAYDITDTAACWELLTRQITVLDVGEREIVYPLVEPGGAHSPTEPVPREVYLFAMETMLQRHLGGPQPEPPWPRCVSTTTRRIGRVCRSVWRCA